MTVFNRPPRVLWNTLAALAENDLTNCEIVIVDDGSTLDYTAQRDFCERSNLPVRWVRIEPDEYPDWVYTIPHPDGGTINNPAMAMNRAIKEAQGKRLMFLSSDCMIPKFGVKLAKQCGERYWLANVVDQATNLMYTCDQRPIPLHFFSSCMRAHVEAIGGFDEEYMRGIAFEDNDFGARLGLHVQMAVFEAQCLVVHQSHPPLSSGDGLKGHVINEAYTRKKWGGVPWCDQDSSDPVKLKFFREGSQLRVVPKYCEPS